MGRRWVRAVWEQVMLFSLYLAALKIPNRRLASDLRVGGRDLDRHRKHSGPAEVLFAGAKPSPPSRAFVDSATTTCKALASTPSAWRGGRDRGAPHKARQEHLLQSYPGGAIRPPASPT